MKSILVLFIYLVIFLTSGLCQAQTLFDHKTQEKKDTLSMGSPQAELVQSTESPQTQAGHQVSANRNNHTYWQSKAKLKKLYDANTWRKLLYFPNLTSNKHPSQGIDDGSQDKVKNINQIENRSDKDSSIKSKVTEPAFFLGNIKTTTPKNEMLLLIEGLFNPVAQDNASIMCRFPARTHFVIEQLKIPRTVIPSATCTNFNEWFKGINPYKTTLVFASDYLNNPSSMFGHTLLRIDQSESGQSLLSYAINYAAQTQGGQGMSFAFKGLTGAYPGMFSIMPYYEKVKDYGDLESRDLWEYELNLSQAQTEQLVRHVWEMGGVKFPYYFLSDNCSYALLGLLDRVVPSLESQSWFTKETIPAQSIKELVKHSTLVRSVRFRPALESQLKAQWFLHGDDIANKAHAQSKSAEPRFTQLKEADQAKVLEMAYDDLYLHYLKQAFKNEAQKQAQKNRLRALLLMRSQNPSTIQRPKVLTLSHSPAVGHDARRLAFTLGYETNNDRENGSAANHNNYMQLGFRGAYHDLIDPPKGFRQGMAIEVLDLALRIQPDRVRLQNATVISIDSFAPKSPFIWPVSWGISGGAKQASGSLDDALVGFLDYRLGYAVGFGDIDRAFDKKNNGVILYERSGFCYAQLGTQAQAGSSLDYGWRLGLGTRLGCLARIDNNTRLSTELDSKYWLSNDVKPKLNNMNHRDEYGLLTTARLVVQHDVNTQHALRFKLSSQLAEYTNSTSSADKSNTDVSLSWLYYYF